MIDRNAGCGNECGAPWNEGDDGECDCWHCRMRRYKEARSEYMMDREPEIDERRAWAGQEG